LYKVEGSGINLDTFKKIFFPHLYLVQEDKDDIDDIEAKAVKDQLDSNKAGYSRVVNKRLLDLETVIKRKFSN